MDKSRQDIKGWKILALRLFHPVPVFFIVTALSALVYALPNFRDLYPSTATSISGITTIFLSFALPIATGLIAALGVHFGLLDLRKKAGSRDGSDSTEVSDMTESRAKAIARHLPIAAFTFDLECKATFLNPAASDLLNIYRPDYQITVDQFIDSNGLRLSLEEVLKGTKVKVEKTGTLPDSPDIERTWKITAVPITRLGEVTEALFLVEDRTQYRVLEDELLRSEDRYRNIFNHAPCGIFFTDSQGNYLDANPSALTMLGYPLEELTTLNTRELSADSERRLRRLKETPGWIEEETRYLRKDGKVVEVELLASSYQSGKDTYFIGIAKDITAKKELEESLSAARARLKAVLSLESRPLLLLDAQDIIANVNSAASELLACPAETLLGMQLNDLVSGEPPPIQETSTASYTPCAFQIPDGPPVNVSVMRLSLGHSDSSGSLLLLSEGSVRMEEGN